MKLTDFGIAEFDGFPRAEQGALQGTVAYMSPEQVVGDAVDARSDLYSVGVILWELVANRRLFPHATELDLLARVRDAQIPLLESLRAGSARVPRPGGAPGDVRGPGEAFPERIGIRARPPARRSTQRLASHRGSAQPTARPVVHQGRRLFTHHS